MTWLKDEPMRPHPINHAVPRDRWEAVLYIRAVLDSGGGVPCVYGHYHCALWQRGPCSDELAGQWVLTEEEL